MRSAFRLLRAGGVLIAGFALACGDTTEPLDETHLILVGYPEVGSNVEVRVVAGTGTDTTPILQAAVRFTPSGSVSASLSGNTFIFSAPGTYTFSTTLTSGRTIASSVVITQPPKIVFDMVSGGNRDIYSATVYGNEITRLTTDPGDDEYPTAANGSVTYTSFRSGNGELFARVIQGPGPESPLTATPANETQAMSSPNGALLAYTRDDGGVPRIWTADANLAHAAALTNNFGGASAIEGNATWSPASDSIAFMSTAQGAPSIFVTSKTTGSTPLFAAKPTTDDSVYVEPTWSANGKTIAFSAAVSGGKGRIAVLTRATANVVMITPATINAGHPAYLKDGRIVFTAFAADGSSTIDWIDPANPANVFVIPLTGTNPQHPAIIWP